MPSIEVSARLFRVPCALKRPELGQRAAGEAIGFIRLLPNRTEKRLINNSGLGFCGYIFTVELSALLDMLLDNVTAPMEYTSCLYPAIEHPAGVLLGVFGSSSHGRVFPRCRPGAPAAASEVAK